MKPASKTPTKYPGISKVTWPTGRVQYEARAPWWRDADGKRHDPTAYRDTLKEAREYRDAWIDRYETRSPGNTAARYRYGLAKLKSKSIWKTKLTPNQLVAYNLRRIRLARGLSQEEASDLCERFLGEKWSKASWSAVERSVDGSRIRELNADEILGLARAFGVSIGYFFLPPAERQPVSGGKTRPTRVKVPDNQYGIPVVEVCELALGLRGRDELDERVAELLEKMPVAQRDQLTSGTPVVARASARVRERESEQWEKTLRAIADDLAATRTQPGKGKK